MSKYTITHGDGAGSAGTLTIDAATDGEAIKQANKLVTDGLRNEAWANVELQSGRVYGVRNAHGEFIGAVTDGC